MTAIYRAGRQLIKVRAIMLLSLVCAALSVWWGIELAQTYGLSPGDGGVLRSAGERAVVGGVIASLGVAFAFAMWIYGRCYAARIDLDPKTGRLHVHTAGLIGTTPHVIDPADIVSSRWHDGELQLRSSVKAPWVSVRLRGARLPLIIDDQGLALDPRAMHKYFGG